MTQRRTVVLAVVLACAVLAVLAVLAGLRRKDATVEDGGRSAADGSPGRGGPHAGGTDEAVDDGLPRGSIAGRIASATGAPIASASVCAFASSDKLVSLRTKTPYCTTSGADGRYKIEPLFPAHYEVSASAAQHPPASWRQPGRERGGLELKSGEAREGIDIVLASGGVEVRGIVKDISGGMIAGAIVTASSGFVWMNGSSAVTQTNAQGEWQLWTAEGSITAHAVADGYNAADKAGIAPGQLIEIVLTPESILQGRVVEVGTDTPVAGARVVASGDGDGPWNLDAHSALSDEQGHFRITGLDPGRYKPRATSPQRWGTARESVLLGLAETSPEVLVEVHPATTVSGKIELPGGRACAQGHASLAEKTNGERRSSQSDEDGRVRIEGLMPGDYQVNIWCEGAASEDKYDAVKVGDKDVGGLVWKVSAGLTVSGVVVLEDGQPVADAGIQARTKGGDPRGQMSWGSAKSSADGTFRLRGLRPGTYALEVHRADATSTKDPIEVKVERDVDGVRLVLPAGGAIDGSVVDSAGAPGASMQVSAVGGDWRSGKSTSTRDDGTFTLRGILPGDYHLRAESGWSPARAPGTKDDDVQGTAVTVKAGATAHVKLVIESRRGEIRGRVIGADGEAISDAFVSAERESDSAAAAPGQARRSMQWQSSWQGGGRSPVLTDVDGNFVLTKLSPGTYTVRAFRKGGGESVVEKVALASKVTLTIKVDGLISGTVSAGKGGAPERFTILMHDDKTGVSRREAFFRTRGAWTLRDLPEGNYHLSAEASEGRALTQVTLAQGEKKQGIALELEGSGSVRGRLIALDSGQPVPAMYVIVQPAKGGSMMGLGGMRDADRKFVSDSDGRFEIERAPAGKVKLLVYPKDFRSAEFAMASVPAVLESGKVNELPPIRLARSRVRDMLGGDLGFGLGAPEPGREEEQEPHIVKVVRPNGPAARAGLVVGDEILSVDGHDVAGANSYLYAGLSGVSEGTTITLGVRRGAAIAIKAEKPVP